MNLSGADDDVSIGRDPLKVMCNRHFGIQGRSGHRRARRRPTSKHMIAEAPTVPTCRVDPHHLRMAARVYAEYQRMLRDANAADFGDLLLWPRAGHAAQPSTIATAGPGASTRVLADEYQDVNHAQYIVAPAARGRGTANSSRSATMTRRCTVGAARTSNTSGASHRTSRSRAGPPRGELPLDRTHPGRRQRRHRAGPRPARQDALHPKARSAIRSRSSASATPKPRRSASSPRSSAGTPRVAAGTTSRSSTAATPCRAASRRR